MGNLAVEIAHMDLQALLGPGGAVPPYADSQRFGVELADAFHQIKNTLFYRGQVHSSPTGRTMAHDGISPGITIILPIP